MNVSKLVSESEFLGDKLFNLVKKIGRGGNFVTRSARGKSQPLCQRPSLENRINRCRILFRDNFLYAILLIHEWVY